MQSTATAPGDPQGGPRWWAFALVCASYLAVTVGEQVLSPVFPTTSDDLGLSDAQGGVAFGVLAASIALANLLGGTLARRYGFVRAIQTAGAVTAAGSVVAALAPGFVVLLVGQVLLGAGAGIFFPAGLQAVASAAGPGRTGFAMGIYGVAFSGGLTAAALLGTLGSHHSWRLSFWVAAGLSVAAVILTGWIRLPAPAQGGPLSRVPLRTVLGLPTAVGSVGAVCQYGAIPFLTTFAVDEWGLSAGQAAAVLAAGRVISILAKVVSGTSADRVGPHASARSTGLVLVATGLAWVLLPAGWPAYALAALFAGTVSSLFPIANMLAIQRFGRSSGALGQYRSAQIAIGAVAGALIGLIGDAVGLRVTLLVAVVTPAALLWLCREPRPEPAGLNL